MYIKEESVNLRAESWEEQDEFMVKGRVEKTQMHYSCMKFTDMYNFL